MGGRGMRGNGTEKGRKWVEQNGHKWMDGNDELLAPKLIQCPK